MAKELEPYDPMRPASIKFTERLKFWENFFTFADTSEIIENKMNAIQELDSLWNGKGYMGRAKYVSGYGFWVKQITEDEVDKYPDNDVKYIKELNYFSVAIHGAIKCMLGISEGLYLSSFDDEDRPALSYQFRQLPLASRSSAEVGIMIANNIQIKVGTLSMLSAETVNTDLSRIVDHYEPYAELN